MKLSTLPWFIRRDIINLVVSTNIEYRFVSKEWLKCTVKLYGKLTFQRNGQSTTISSLIERDIETVSFERLQDIDWDLITRCENINQVSVRISPFRFEPRDFEIFQAKLSLIRPLIKLYFTGPCLPYLDISRVIVNQITHLKCLAVDMKSFNVGRLGLLRSTKIDSLILSNITNATSLEGLAQAMPNLKCLLLDFDLSFFISRNGSPNLNSKLNFGRLEMVKDLALNWKRVAMRIVTEVDLSQFPNLKTLTLQDEIDITDNELKPNIANLNITGSQEHCYNILSKTSLLHKNLVVKLQDDFDVRFSSTLFKLCLVSINLESLSLTISRCKRIYKRISPGSPSLRILKLSNVIITPWFISNLSRDFQLRELHINSCIFHTKGPAHLPEPPPPSPPLFSHLNRVLAIGKEVNNALIQQYINPTTCPQASDLKFINI